MHNNNVECFEAYKNSKHYKTKTISYIMEDGIPVNSSMRDFLFCQNGAKRTLLAIDLFQIAANSQCLSMRIVGCFRFSWHTFFQKRSTI